MASLNRLFEWNPLESARLGEEGRWLVAHSHEHLLRGGFPQPALMESITQAHKLLREDIVDKVLEVKYRSQTTGLGELNGMLQFCAEPKVARGYVITREVTDFGVLPLGEAGSGAMVVKIPAPLACYWLGRSEVENADKQ